MVCRLYVFHILQANAISGLHTCSTLKVKVVSGLQNMGDGAENLPIADSSEEEEDSESQGIMTRLQSTVEATQV